MAGANHRGELVTDLSNARSGQMISSYPILRPRPELQSSAKLKVRKGEARIGD
jgi:hypothetical protein